MDEYGDGPWITDEKQREPLKVCQVYQLHGPPGCGKTTALATVWIPRAVDLFGSDGVAVCSLTKAAAVEIAARGLTVDPEMVGTLHALSFRALGRPPLTVGKVDKWNEVALPQHRLTAQRGPSTAFDDPGDSRGGPADGDALLASVELLRHCRTPEDQWPPAEREWYTLWTDWKRAEGLVDFTDLIEQAVEYTDAPKGNMARCRCPGVRQPRRCGTRESARTHAVLSRPGHGGGLCPAVDRPARGATPRC